MNEVNEAEVENSILDERVNAAGALREKLIDVTTRGVWIEFDPDEAELMGAFVEDALSEQDAAESEEGLVDGAVPMMDDEED